jgi:predicted MPP superfamily phosphohydrolase
MLIIMILVALAIYSGINFWIGLRAWQGLFKYLPHSADFRVAYWIVFILIAFSYILGRLLLNYFPANLNRIIAWVGSFWMAAMFYLVLILFVFEILRLTDHFLHIIPTSIKGNPSFPLILGLAIFLTVTGILVYGSWNALNPRVHRYELAFDKKAGDLNDLHIVMVSDIHLGTIHQNSTLTGLVERVNELDPDLVLFAGDVIDENVEVFIEQKMADVFQLLKSKYGVYASLGNHEYIGGHAEEAIKYLGEGGVKVLRDEVVQVANSFYVIGRDDASGGSFRGVKRSDLHPLVEPLDRSLPLILMDHQPSQIDEAVAEGIDLQLSGHTHRGQMWPNQYITQRIFPQDWGLLQKGTFNLIVSNGYGTWGPPIRIGNQPEIVDIHIQFTP